MLDTLFLVGVMITFAGIVSATMFFFEWIAAKFPEFYCWIIRSSTAVAFFGIIFELFIDFPTWGLATFLFLVTPGFYYFISRELQNFREDRSCGEQFTD